MLSSGFQAQRDGDEAVSRQERRQEGRAEAPGAEEEGRKTCQCQLIAAVTCALSFRDDVRASRETR